MLPILLSSRYMVSSMTTPICAPPGCPGVGPAPKAEAGGRAPLAEAPYAALADGLSRNTTCEHAKYVHIRRLKVTQSNTHRIGKWLRPCRMCKVVTRSVVFVFNFLYIRLLGALPREFSIICGCIDSLKWSSRSARRPSAAFRRLCTSSRIRGRH